MWEPSRLTHEDRRVTIGAKVLPCAEPDGNRICCGQPMEPRLVHARDRSGQTLFVAIWRCTNCGRTVV